MIIARNGNNNNNNNNRASLPIHDSFNNNRLNTENIFNDKTFINYLKRFNRNTHKQKTKRQKTNGLL